jgi:hypothetical protein
MKAVPEVCITIIIPADIDSAIERRSKVEGKLKRQVVKEALAAYIKEGLAR